MSTIVQVRHFHTIIRIADDSGGTIEPPPGGYDFKSSSFDRFSEYPITEATIRMTASPGQNDFMHIRIPSPPIELICHFGDQYGSPTQPWIGSREFLDQSNNVNGMIVRPIRPGKFAVTLECYEKGPSNDGSMAAHFERYIITVTD